MGTSAGAEPLEQALLKPPPCLGVPLRAGFIKLLEVILKRPLHQVTESRIPMTWWFGSPFHF